jgi:hypothetical protein
MIDIEVYSYTILAAILGMLVVFGFLWFLSILMSVLVKVFADKKPEVKTVFAVSVKGTASDWVFAAAAAFLSEEELECSVSAESWGPGNSEKSDPWVHGTKLPRKWSGV